MSDASSSSISVLGDLLDLQARTRPGAQALTDGSSSLTWLEYRTAAVDLAAELEAVGVGRGDRVAILLPKSVGSFVAVHAILRLGAVVVPVDWFAPPAHARDVIADAGVTAIVSDADDDVLAGIRPDDDTPVVVRPDATGVASDDGPATDATPVSPGSPDDDAYIVYTSGSTGRPKGIVHTHASALAYARAAVDLYGLDADDRLVNVAPLHFDQSTFELYAAPMAGAATIVLSDVMLRFPASAGDLVARERATVWYSVPHAITQLVTRGALDRHDLSSMRWVLFGGETFRTDALAEAMRAVPSARFSNVYGPAEVNQCTFHHLDEPPGDDEPVPIGRAWRVARLRVVDGSGSEVGSGEQGELLVSTSSMMSRYWNRPDLTDEAIVDDGDGRWYRTGDLVVRGADGSLVFRGRVDHQVKLRGHRIELEAIEAVVGEHADVDDCAVVLRRAGDANGNGGDGEDHLVAVVSPRLDDHRLAAVAEHARQRLPRYAVPSRFVDVPTVPRSRNGKIDRPGAADIADRAGDGWSSTGTAARATPRTTLDSRASR